MNIIEMRNFIKDVVTVILPREGEKVAIKTLEDRFSSIKESTPFKFTFSRPAGDQKWVAVAIPKFGYNPATGSPKISMVDCDINLTMFERGIFAGNEEAVSSLAASVIYKNAFDLDPFRSIKEYAISLVDNPLFIGHVGDNINEMTFFEKLISNFPTYGGLLFMTPRVMEIPNETIKSDILLYQKLTSEFDLFDYRYLTRHNELFVNSLLNLVASDLYKGELNRGIPNRYTGTNNKYRLNIFEIEVDQCGSKLLKTSSKYNAKTFEVLITGTPAEFWKLLDKSVDENIFDFLSESAFDGKINYLKMQRDIDIMMSEIPDIKSLGDKQVLIDMVYNSIGKVQSHLQKYTTDKMAQDLLDQLYNVRNQIRDAKINQRRSILTVTYPEGYEG